MRRRLMMKNLLNIDSSVYVGEQIKKRRLNVNDVSGDKTINELVWAESIFNQLVYGMGGTPQHSTTFDKHAPRYYFIFFCIFSLDLSACFAFFPHHGPKFLSIKASSASQKVNDIDYG